MNWERIMRLGNSRGFTLIELMIVVAVIAVLAAIAYPAYSQYGYRSRRSDGQDFLMQIAAAEERYYTNFNTYTTSVTGTGSAGLGMTSATSPENFYTVAVAAPAAGVTIASGFLATATPTGVQAGDTSCTTLSIDNTGTKRSTSTGTSTNGSCW
jgi:type IV pilus assembly protein PilE